MAKPVSKNLIATFDLEAPYVTEVRRLLQTLARRSKDSDRRVFLVTSAGRGEGKSTLCALLAVVAARIFHKRTLLIDADMRRPTAHNILGVAQRSGLYEALHGKAPLENAVRATALPTLSALPSGKPMGSISEAYDDEAFRVLLETLRPRYDLIFIDAAPAVPVIEPLLIAEHVDGILIVAMAGRTPVAMVRRMRALLDPLSAKIDGVILNNATEGLPYYYDYRYYGYEPVGARKHRT